MSRSCGVLKTSVMTDCSPPLSITRSGPRWCWTWRKRLPPLVKKLKERGLLSPYLRSFVVALINPLRWIKGDAPPLEDVLKTMRERVAKFNIEKIKPQDLAGAAGPPDEEP
jgi:hypothetical protein